MGKENLEKQIEGNLARRVAIAAGIITATAVAIAGRERIMPQITRAINKLPDFYESLANSRHAWLGLVRTDSPEIAEDVFLHLMDRGSDRLQIDPKFISFMAPPYNHILHAEAARSKIGGVFVTMSEEEDLRRPVENRRSLLFIRLTSRRLDASRSS